MRNIILENAKKLPGKEYKNISIAPDLTKKQREDNNKLRQEVQKKNDELEGEEAENYTYRLVGQRGQRRILKQRKTGEKSKTEKRRSEDRGGESPQAKQSRGMGRAN